MTVRVQVILDESERAEFRRQARQEGQSLSAWLREAGRERIRTREQAPKFTDRQSLAEFFDCCDRHAGEGREPDWAEHRRVIDHSRRAGLPEA
ncbi:MAG: antitoxin [Gammaproteobacteria bacterium HGW-Gammaproteobacteria-8]|nr:MAG: antitoxin [Gammaproteobacteria bacterium HGW-Gammaproteobacteria-8]